jgi:hypothetical protein
MLVIVLVVLAMVLAVMLRMPVVAVLPAAGVGSGGKTHPEEASEQGGGQQGETARDPGRHGVLLVPRTTLERPRASNDRFRRAAPARLFADP